LGYSFGQALLVKTNNGRWSVIFGNGYNSTQADSHTGTTGQAYLYVLDAETGAVTAKIATGAGSTSNPNGLSGPVAIDVNGDGIVDVVYAGDLLGNLWKFNLSSTSVSNWAPAYGATPMFSTGGAPITVRPEVGVMPASQGGRYIVLFGTGRYIDTSDNAAGTTQTFFGVKDTGTAVAGLGSLVQQTIAGTANGSTGNTFRLSTHAVGPPTLDSTISGDNAVSTAAYLSKSGWYLNLPDSGERVIADAAVRAGRVIFTSIEPSTVLCSAGGSGWVMDLDMATGNRLDTVAFDTNGNLILNNSDLLTPPSASGAGTGALDNASGAKIGSIPSAAGFLRLPQGQGPNGYENKYLNTTAGTVKVVGETSGKTGSQRLSWEQIK
jgi:type IV pilus assembly protein PilY1